MRRDNYCRASETFGQGTCFEGELGGAGGRGPCLGLLNLSQDPSNPKRIRLSHDCVMPLCLSDLRSQISGVTTKLHAPLLSFCKSLWRTFVTSSLPKMHHGPMQCFTFCASLLASQTIFGSSPQLELGTPKQCAGHIPLIRFVASSFL